jgi:hypothetical protein
MTLLLHLNDATTPDIFSPSPVSRGSFFVVRLDVVIQRELVGMRTYAERVHFLLSLVRDVSLQQVFGKDIAL